MNGSLLCCSLSPWPPPPATCHKFEVPFLCLLPSSPLLPRGNVRRDRAIFHGFFFVSPLCVSGRTPVIKQLCLRSLIEPKASSSAPRERTGRGTHIFDSYTHAETEETTVPQPYSSGTIRQPQTAAGGNITVLSQNTYSSLFSPSPLPPPPLLPLFKYCMWAFLPSWELSFFLPGDLDYAFLPSLCGPLLGGVISFAVGAGRSSSSPPDDN